MQHISPKRQKVPRELSIRESNRQYADVCVMVNDQKTGKGKILQPLLDSDCPKSMILKNLHRPKRKLD